MVLLETVPKEDDKKKKNLLGLSERLCHSLDNILFWRYKHKKEQTQLGQQSRTYQGKHAHVSLHSKGLRVISVANSTCKHARTHVGAGTKVSTRTHIPALFSYNVISFELMVLSH